LEQKGLTHVLHHFPTLIDIDIDWSIIEKELMQWGDLFRSGKKLREDLSLIT